jgi:hypothetical protein
MDEVVLENVKLNKAELLKIAQDTLDRGEILTKAVKQARDSQQRIIYVLAETLRRYLLLKQKPINYNLINWFMSVVGKTLEFNDVKKMYSFLKAVERGTEEYGKYMFIKIIEDWLNGNGKIEMPNAHTYKIYSNNEPHAYIKISIMKSDTISLIITVAFKHTLQLFVVYLHAIKDRLKLAKIVKGLIMSDGIVNAFHVYITNSDPAILALAAMGLRTSKLLVTQLSVGINGDINANFRLVLYRSLLNEEEREIILSDLKGKAKMRGKLTIKDAYEALGYFLGDGVVAMTSGGRGYELGFAFGFTPNDEITNSLKKALGVDFYAVKQKLLPKDQVNFAAALIKVTEDLTEVRWILYYTERFNQLLQYFFTRSKHNDYSFSINIDKPRTLYRSSTHGGYAIHVPVHVAPTILQRLLKYGAKYRGEKNTNDGFIIIPRQAMLLMWRDGLVSIIMKAKSKSTN